MGVQFIIGRAGSGKTIWCYERTIAACKADPMGPPIIWLTPRQATFQTERDLCCASDLGGYFRVQVVSFERFSREILAEVGGAAIPEVTDLGRQMILGHLLRKLEPQLTFFRSVARQSGLANELSGTFDELERSGADPGELSSKLAGADLANTALVAKMRDLELIHRAYSDFLGQDRLDPTRRVHQALAAMEQCASLKDAVFFVDGFHAFSQYERHFLAGCARASQSMQITLTIDPQSPVCKNANHLPDDLSLFHRTEMTYRKLRFDLSQAGVPMGRPVYLREGRRFSSGGLAHIESWKTQGAASADGVEFIEAPDRRAEVDAAARKVRRLVFDGLRYRDIAILMRDVDDYHELIAASFAEHRIPFFVDRRRTAAHHPLVQFIRAALAVAGAHWPHDALMILAKSGLSGLTPHEADELENYVLLHGIQGGTWARAEPWTGRRTPPRDGDDGLSDAVPSAENADLLRRRIVDKLAPFVAAMTSQAAQSVRHICLGVFKLLESFGVRATLTQWAQHADASGELEHAEEHQQVWTELVAFFDQFVDVLGEEQLSLADFTAVLETGLERFDLALTPPTVDQVLVGPVDRTRTPALKATIVLGLNEGQFPRMARPDSVLSDADRRTLAASAVNVDPDTQRRALDEEFLGYLAFTRASQTLVATRYTSDEKGALQGPGALWARLRQAVPTATLTTIPREDLRSAATISTPRQLVTRLMQWVRATPESTEDAPETPWPALYQWLATHACCEDAVDIMRYRAWRALSYANTAELSPDIAGQLFTGPLKAHVSQLETFQNCPFQHFLKYGLHLSERGNERVSAQDLSQVYHDVLERLLKRLMAQETNWCDLPPRAVEPMVRELAQEVGRQLKGELMLSTARNQYLLDHIVRTLTQVIAAQRAAALRGQFRPFRAKLRFGEGGSLPALHVKTPAGHDVLLNGTIDRVDLIADGAAAAVFDYRLSTVPLALSEVFWGMSLKLLTDLLALQFAGASLPGGNLLPTAAFNVPLLRKISDCHPDDALEPSDERFHLKIKPRGIFNARYAPALDSQLAPGEESDVIAARLNKDSTFGYRDRTDVAAPAEFAALLDHVRLTLGEIADDIIEGGIGIKPYRLGRTTPCPRCAYRDVCRFDPMSGYKDLEPLKREEVLRRVNEKTG